MMQEDAPFDGVIPSEYPRVYHALLYSKCVKLRDEVNCIYVGQLRRLTLCNWCYNPYLYAREETVNIIRNLHGVGAPTDPILICACCRRALVTIRPAITCGKCTDTLI